MIHEYLYILGCMQRSVQSWAIPHEKVQLHMFMFMVNGVPVFFGVERYSYIAIAIYLSL